ncbi:cyclin-dependent kinase inhibitor 1B-like [Anomaloglossus baeobatrachus]|uniref:cyclin-dependent kinase inhibitor 1B-like n=1 Tax=Anomaloglossus baeobatrachus TaxID=238106 RepID=UPI003F506DAD
MSDVRLSPGSPGVERVSRAPGSPRTPARRCLFGPVDHELLGRELERRRRELEDEKRQRWNYDFTNDRPLHGALSWEEAGPDTPDFYRRGPHRKPGDTRGRKRSGEPAGESRATEPPSSNARISHRTESGESAEGGSTPSPEKTPKKSRPST